MNRRKGKIYAVLITILIIAVSGGCTPQKKLIPPPGPDPVPPDKVPRMNVKLPPNKAPRESTDIAADISRVSERASGVTKAYTIVLGNVAIIGVKMGGSPALGIPSLKQRIISDAERDPRIDKAYVTTDSAETDRLKSISDSVRKGKPVTDYMDQLNNIIKKASS